MIEPVFIKRKSSDQSEVSADIVTVGKLSNTQYLGYGIQCWAKMIAAGDTDGSNFLVTPEHSALVAVSHLKGRPFLSFLSFWVDEDAGVGTADLAYTEPEARGVGLFRHMLMYLNQVVLPQNYTGVKTMDMTVRASNAPMRAIYDKMAGVELHSIIYTMPVPNPKG